jgi:peptidoglycan/LPS O-acetylase OafA/YrhL
LEISALDAVRGLAALYVVAYHSRLWLWSGVKSDAGGGIIFHILDVVWQGLSFGRFAVLVFFLISGFCIHYRQAKSLSRQPQGGGKGLPLDLAEYAKRRLRRLYPPLAVALAFTAVVDYAGRILNPAFYAGHTPYESLNSYVPLVGDHSLPTLL